LHLKCRSRRGILELVGWRAAEVCASAADITMVALLAIIDLLAKKELWENALSFNC